MNNALTLYREPGRHLTDNEVTEIRRKGQTLAEHAREVLLDAQYEIEAKREAKEAESAREEAKIISENYAACCDWVLARAKNGKAVARMALVDGSVEAQLDCHMLIRKEVIPLLREAGFTVKTRWWSSVVKVII